MENRYLKRLIETNIGLTVDEQIIYLICKDQVVNLLLGQIENEKKKISKIEWVSIREVLPYVDIKRDAILKQLQNGEFEEGVDFKHDGGKIVINQGAIKRIRRKRRS